VLGVFRIGFGLTLLYDLLRRAPEAGLLWSSDGVLSSEALEKLPQSKPQWSLLLGLSSSGQVQLAFAVLGVVFVLYALGLFTRVMQVLVLVGYVSLNSRNLFFEDGGTGCCVLLSLWTLLLPLGDRFSLDALRRNARLPSVAARVQARAEAQAPLISLAAFALLLQAAVIYWLNAVHKSGHTWRDGDAVHLVLWQHRVNTPMAVWFAAHEPRWFSPVVSWLTVRTEYLMPVLLLWPTFQKATRSLAFALAVLLHGSIALSLTLGPFSYAMICLVWLSVPGEALDELAARLPRRGGARLLRLRANALRGWQRLFVRAKTAGTAPPPQTRPLSIQIAGRVVPLREVAVVVMMLAETCDILSQNRAVPSFLKVPGDSWAVLYKPYVRARQGWSMFAPNAPEEDGTLVVDAVTESGRHVDPFTGNAPDFDQVRRGVVPHSIALSDYLFNMRSKDNSRYRRELKRYLRGLRYNGERLVASEQWWVSYTPPRRGSYEPGPLKKELLWKMKL
jgi:hypothetical protein